ncbi:MAG: methyltransferase domain-containing protein [Actinobacteria bacterium]|nr:methyltransferase domain-containing protein [Actinomycetota bacterium]
MERATVERYEECGGEWAARRRPVRREAAIAFSRRVAPGALRLDVGAGAGRYTNELGEPVVALDAARTMLDLLAQVAPAALPLQADIEALPLRAAAAGGAWANMSYLHVPRTRLPLALADLHRSLLVDSPVDVQVLHGTYEGDALPGDDFGGRFFAAWEPQPLLDVLTGAGFSVDDIEVERDEVRAAGRRARTLPDTVGPGMRLLVCGLNPSIYSADRGVGYARPGNRFWPAALAAGVVSRAKDAWNALRHHGLGMTDLCKRATVASAELSPEEYREGAARVERLVRWLQPGAVCFVGLEGWRAVFDRRAGAGPQPGGFGGRPAYVMPSTSGLNARTPLGELVEHLRAAAALAGANPSSSGRQNSAERR